MYCIRQKVEAPKIVENINDETACIKACLPEDFLQTESALLTKAKTYMARLPFDRIDILILDEMGKNNNLMLTADIGPLGFEEDGRLPVI